MGRSGAACLEAAHKKWPALVKKENATAWEIGHQQMTSRLQIGKVGLLDDCLTDALANWATSARHARAGHLLQYCKFCQDAGQTPWPLQESVVYAYFKHMGDRPAATQFHFHLPRMSLGYMLPSLFRILAASVVLRQNTTSASVSYCRRIL